MLTPVFSIFVLLENEIWEQPSFMIEYSGNDLTDEEIMQVIEQQYSDVVDWILTTMLH